MPQESLVRVVDAFVETLDLTSLGFERTISAATGRPGYHPGDMLRLYIWGYLNQLRSSRQLERACQRDLEAIWLMRQMTPDYRTIAAFRHDNPEAISPRAPHSSDLSRERPCHSRKVALDGTKMRAVASAKNIAGADRLARDIAHTETESPISRPSQHSGSTPGGRARSDSQSRGFCRRDRVARTPQAALGKAAGRAR
ncbi:transposase [Paracoccus sp. (in: a-proteobacteria)]|uniref:transposase n=1 Tax=Paracoccus sp. TaxID=267 RepID=UPI002AFE41E2|nr:transposase [Paracoccus sp. (in: a-proteobacteria)]